MSNTRNKGETSRKEVSKVAAVELPEPKGELIVVSEVKPDLKKVIQSRMNELDLSNTQSIIEFGTGAQSELQVISRSMLDGVRNKDVGPAGDSLRSIVSSIRGFSIDELNPNRRRSWWEKLIGRAEPVVKFMARYETVQAQIDNITDDLMGHEHTLLKDIKSLDKLYGKTLAFYDELAIYIAAGEEKTKELDEKIIPAKEIQVENAGKDKGVLRAQELRDMRASRDDLERRVHDLKLTRQVTMQSLPSIRLVQENDKSLVTKINSTLVNTVPLWETQLAQAVTIHRSREAAASVKAANDLTNELLESNAANLQVANREVRKQMERGVFDIESIKRANQYLIDTIQESLAIADEGKTMRATAEKELEHMEAELKKTLSAAKAKGTGTGDTIGISTDS
ncbi:MAG: toxic anion resistance protein [Rhodobacteraceae bacterium]|nr:toxic anion resistance protein [Paracoccaceae bacterium]